MFKEGPAMTAYQVLTPNLLLTGFYGGFLGWILTVATIGMVHWRVWRVDDAGGITSGVAWIGVWRVCFYSHALVVSDDQVMFCQGFGVSDSFVPPEIRLAQALTLAALVTGAGGSAAAVYGLRNVYFGLPECKPLRTAFSLAGALYTLTGACSLVPLAWNISSVLANRTILFPARFHMPPAPVSQDVGAGILVGVAASILLVSSGAVFLLYGYSVSLGPRIHPSCPKQRDFDACINCVSSSQRSLSIGNKDMANTHHSQDNPALQSQENL